jgi:hypothetical protein
MRRSALLAICASSLLLTSPAFASFALYSSEASWSAAVENLQSFDTSNDNIALANEIGYPPGSNADLGSLLTFEVGNTGLSWGFTLMNPNVTGERGLVFEDSEAGLGGPRNISIGDADGVGDPSKRSQYENDDWRVAILSGPPLTAFAFTLVGNDASLAESLQFYSGATLIATVTDLLTPNGSRFFGIVSTDPITRIVFDEDEIDPGPDHDDIAIRDFAFGQMRSELTPIESNTWSEIKGLFR